METTEREGVIRFRAEHRSEPFDPGREPEVAAAAGRLAGWRRILRALGVVGQDPGRYGGYGFGNLSARLPPWPALRGRRRFLVSGTQTSGREHAAASDFALVEHCLPAENRVASRGPALPSSESLTHGALYDLTSEIRAVFHVHDPELWRRAGELGLPVTSPEAAEGTPAIAAEIARLRPGWVLAGAGVVAMGGHQDGVLAFGRSEEEAGTRLVAALARAWSRG